MLDMRGVACIGRDLVRRPLALTRWWHCPICNWRGPFTSDYRGAARHYARCPGCGSFERHRLICLVMTALRAQYNFSRLRMLHFAPERMFKPLFAGWFGRYETADIRTDGAREHNIVDRQLDVRSMPEVANGSYDVVLASHVLEHVKEDGEAVAEISRILAPGAIALLPVPIVAATTIEYPHAVPEEQHHVRAPGLDYYDRFRPHFAHVEIHTSAEYDDRHQPWTWEDRTSWPNGSCPYRLPMPGVRHLDTVPVCLK